MKHLLLALVAVAALGLAGCDSKAENQAENRAEQAENAADRVDETAVTPVAGDAATTTVM